MTSKSRFETDTQVEQQSETSWRFTITEGWRIHGVPNGGFVLAIAARVLSEALPHKDPLSINAFYLAPTVLGEGLCEVEVLRVGGNTSFAQLKLVQQGEVKVQVTAAYTLLDKLDGPSWAADPAPDYPAPEHCLPRELPEHNEMREQVSLHIAEGSEIFRGQPPAGGGVIGGWIEHTDKTAPDPYSVLMFADTFLPPIFTVVGFQSWVPTIELTVQMRAKPSPGPMKVRFATRQLSKGILEEDGQLWDSEDQLVAISRQTAKLRM